jgi:curved DNA-binding protein CbpA
VENWKNYYNILNVSSSAEAQTIDMAYYRLSNIFNHLLSNRAKGSKLFSEILSDINEAYQILSVPINRTAYDRTFWLKYNAKNSDINETDKICLIDLSQSIAQDVSSAKRRIIWRVPALNKVTHPVVIGVAIFLLVGLVGGNILAFTNPEHALAAPFRDVAFTLKKQHQTQAA